MNLVFFDPAEDVPKFGSLTVWVDKWVVGYEAYFFKKFLSKFRVSILIFVLYLAIRGIIVPGALH